MAKKKGMKGALISSVLSIALSCTTFVGTTFAWFTDSATSDGNVIQTGTLDIGFYWAKGEQAVPTADEGWTNAESGSIFDYDNWEPGYAVARHLKIVNEGTLAFKYKLNIVPNGTVSELADVIDVYFVPTATQITSRTQIVADYKVGTLREMIEDPDGAAYGVLTVDDTATTDKQENVQTATVVFKMQESAGNQYQGKSIGSDFAIRVMATQYTVEKDSFDENYDANATYPATGKITVSTEDFADLGNGTVGYNYEIEDENGTNMASITITDDMIDTNAEEVTVFVAKTNTYEGGNFTVADGETAQTFEIKVDGLKENNTEEVTVTLRIAPNLDPATVKLYHYDEEIPVTYIPHSGYVMFKTLDFSPFTVVYDADSKMPTFTFEDKTEDEIAKIMEDLPVAIVTEAPQYVNVDIDWGNFGGFAPNAGTDPQLQAAFIYQCKESAEEAKENPFASWYCDFYVSLDKDLGENEIFLGGNYGAFGWVGFHNQDITLNANEEIPLLGSVAQQPWTYEMIASFVGTFTCGVSDVNNALANKGATFTVKLRLTNPANEKEYVDISTIHYSFAK